MDRKEAVVRFVRENLRSLIDKRASKSGVKQLRKTFFERHRLPASARFSNPDIARKVVAEVSSVKKNLSETELLELLTGIPFLRDELGQSELEALIESLSLGKEPILTRDDLKRLREEDYLARIEAELITKAKREAEAVLEEEWSELAQQKEQVEQAKESLEALRSELDSLPPDIVVDELIEETEEAGEGEPLVLWWRELGLEADPFSTNQGLFGIPEAKYDDIIVKTPFVQSYLDRVSQSPEEFLGKTRVILGEFGSGKTTLFQVMGHQIGRRGILPVMTLINPDESVAKLTRQLISQISEKVSDTLRYRADARPDESLAVGDSIGNCVRLLAAVAESTGDQGFLFFVDGLHKSVTYESQSLEFLQQLQNFQERLFHSGLSCGIMVAGSLSWNREFESNPTLSGSFYSKDTVPPLSEENGIEAVLRRIHAFVSPGSPNPSIERAPLRRAFRVLSRRLLRPPTFRDYLDHVRERLVAREYEDMGLSVGLHAETIESVKQDMEEDILGAAYLQLMDPAGHTSSFRNAMARVLQEIYWKKGIRETGDVFRRNVGAFLALRNAKFIVARRWHKRNIIQWQLAPRLLGFLQQLYDKHQVPPAEALEALFTDPVTILPQEAETIYSHVLRQMERMAAAWRSSWPEIVKLVEDASRRVEYIERASENLKGLTSSRTLEALQISLRKLISALMYSIGTQEKLGSFSEDLFLTSWWAPENAEALVGMLRRSTPLPDEASESFGILHQHAQAMSQMCRLLSDWIQGESISRLTGRALSDEDIAVLHEARTLFLSQRYAGAIDRVSGIVDSKVKDIVYPALRCAAAFRAPGLIPSDVRERLAKPLRGHPRTKRSPDENFFYDVSRSEYSKIIFGKNTRRLIFPEMPSDEELKRLKESMELMFSLEDREAHRDRPTYFRRHSTEIVDALKHAPRICERLNGVVERLVIGSGFNLEKISDDTVEYAFGPSEKSFRKVRIGESEVESSVFEVLSILEGGALLLPPLGRLVDVFHGTPENAIAILRASIEWGLADVNKRPRNSGFIITLSQKGKERLAHLRARQSAL